MFVIRCVLCYGYQHQCQTQWLWRDSDGADGHQAGDGTAAQDPKPFFFRFLLVFACACQGWPVRLGWGLGRSGLRMGWLPQEPQHNDDDWQLAHLDGDVSMDQ